MSIWDALVEGLVEDVQDDAVSQEDMDWYLSTTYVDPMERVDW